MRSPYDYDRDHLRLLATFHYVLAGLLAAFGCLPSVYLILGIVMLSGAFDRQPNPPPPAVGAIFTGIGGVGVLLAWTLAGLVAVAGRSLATYRRYRFCLVIAGLECLWMPLGTILGVFTLIVLLRPGAKVLFGEGEPTELVIDPQDEGDAPRSPAIPPPDDGSYRADPAPRQT
jgi:hypothetical protein